MSDLETEPVPDKRARVLAAALAVFGRYGFKRVAMEDVAAEAQMSRPALYLLFKNKRDIFRTAAATFCADGIERAEAALRGRGSFKDRLTAALLARSAAAYRQIHGLAHGAELLAMNGDIAGDIMAADDRRAAAVFATAIRKAQAAKEIDLARAGLTPERLATLLLTGAAGLKTALPTPDVYERGIGDLAALTLAAVKR